MRSDKKILFEIVQRLNYKDTKVILKYKHVKPELI